jgi:hypothetical protein
VFWYLPQSYLYKSLFQLSKLTLLCCLDTTRRLDLQMPPIALNIHLLVSILKSIRLFLIRNKHILLTIIIFVLRTTCILHPYLPCRQRPTSRLQRLKFRILHIIHIFTQMLYALHDRLGLAVLVSGPRGFSVHFIGDERQFVGALKEYVKGGFELEDGLEDGAAAEDV